MKKLLLVLLPTILITGCFWQNTDITDILKAQQFCKGKGKVKNIEVNFMGQEIVTCVNGVNETLSNVTLKLAKE